ncbi:MAG: CTP synthetase, partial [Deferribacterales bacterium]|nr:CTP synthetase [Deferribacterales bacterium]
ERHRHRYEFNPAYIREIEKAGLTVSAYYEELLPEIVEISDHPFFIGVQFHPEFNSSIGKPHPLFSGLIEAAAAKHKQH